MVKRKRLSSPSPNPYQDCGTPETRQHGAAELFYAGEPGTGLKFPRYRVRIQVGIDYLMVTGKISRRQHEAAERLRVDRHMAGLEQRCTIDLTAVGGGGRSEWSDLRVAAWQRVNRALGAVSADECEVIIWITDGQSSLTDVGRRRGARSARAASDLGRALVGLALDSLATHYGIPYND